MATVGRFELIAGQLREMIGGTPADWSDDLTMLQLRVLTLIARRQPIGVSDIGSAFRISPASASAVIDRLARLGLVTRREDVADRRRKLVELNRRGRAVLDEHEARGRRRMRELIERMSPTGREALLTALEEMVRVYDEHTS
jgi:DNA-binding MarR family transcriptional regulator